MKTVKITSEGIHCGNREAVIKKSEGSETFVPTAPCV